MPNHEVPEPFDLWATLRTTGVGTRVGGSWVWTTSTVAGVGTLELTPDGGGVRARTWGDGADVLRERVPWLLGLRDPGWERVPEPVRDLWASAPGLRLGANRALYETVASTVVGQVVTTKEAKSSIRRLVAALGPVGHGPYEAVRGFPEPTVLAGMRSFDLHPFGIERRRAEILIEVARRSKRIEEAMAMDIASAERRLLAIRGLGPWTVGTAMGAAYGSTDAVPVGDYHLPNAVAFALAGEERADDDRMLELLEPYRPHRRRVVELIIHAGIRAPRYGPKTAPRMHL